MKITRDRLAEKGWSEKEIEHAMNIFEKAEKKKRQKSHLLDKSIYWIALVLMIFGTFAFSTFLIPILVTFQNVSLYFIILLLAASFGVLMSVVIKDIEDLEKHHHLLIFLIVPITAIINFLIVVNIANNNPLAHLLSTHHNPFVVGFVYLAGLLIPYTYLVFEEKWKQQK
ncbi:MAG: hypothetical protein ABIB43_05500 [archaeon]